MEDDWKTIRLKCLRTVYERQVIREKAPAYLDSRRIRKPQDVFELLYDLQLEAKEHFLALHLDNQNKILCMDRISVGSLSQAVVHPREVFKGAMLSSAAAMILVHNHPSGDPEPSNEDKAVTQRLKEVGELVGIRVVDHVILGEKRFLSFSELGLM